AKTGFSRSESSYVQTGFQLKLDIFKDIVQFYGLYNFEGQQTFSDAEDDLDSYGTRNLINKFTVIENGELKYGIPYGSIRDYSSRVLSGNRGRGQLVYNQAFGKHDLRVLTGSEISDRQTVS